MISTGESSAWPRLSRALDANVASTRDQAAQVRGLLSDAVAALHASFTELTQDVKAQRVVLGEAMAGQGDASGTDIRGFVEKTQSLLAQFADTMVEFTEQSTLISAKIDDMVEHMDSIFERVRAVDSIAEDTALLAINASLEAARAGEHGKGFQVVASEVRSLSRNTRELSTQIVGDIEKANASVHEVRDVVAQMAAQDVQQATATREQVDRMQDDVLRMNERLAGRLTEVDELGARIDRRAADAIRALQFEDMSSQLLQQIEERAARDRELLARASLEEAAALVESTQTSTPSSPVSQQVMEAGDIDLF